MKEKLIKLIEGLNNDEMEALERLIQEVIVDSEDEIADWLVEEVGRVWLSTYLDVIEKLRKLNIK